MWYPIHEYQNDPSSLQAQRVAFPVESAGFNPTNLLPTAEALHARIPLAPLDTRGPYQNLYPILNSITRGLVISSAGTNWFVEV
jgi:hypothetical protein